MGWSYFDKPKKLTEKPDFKPLNFKDAKPIEGVEGGRELDCGDHMPIGEFMEICRSGGFIDYDGWGDLATADKISDISVTPSRALREKIPEWATHIVWYNKIIHLNCAQLLKVTVSTA